MGKFEIKQTATGHTFHLKAVNGEIIGTSQVYASLEACKKGIVSVKENAPIAATEDQTKEGFLEEKNPKFEIYKDKAGAFRFRLNAVNGQEILASQAYVEEGSAQKGIESVRKNAPDAEIVELPKDNQ
ncbi:MAG: YegP family protein [Lachnospiraceae bacterium]|nr:YegP family protein [Lachnospiraceae bacterium]